MTPLRTLGLCEGVGGIALGLERTGGFRHDQFVEIDPFCQRVLAKHWPDVPCHADIKDYYPDRPFDVVTAGFPCQPASLAGKRKGVEDDRWLWPDVARIVGDVDPDWVILENVRGLCANGLAEVLADLAWMGYDAEWQVVSAASLGAPHIRERVLIVAYPQRQLLREQSRGSCGEDGERTALARYDGEEGPVADAYLKGRYIGPWDVDEASGRLESEDGRPTLADARRAGRDAARLHPRVYVEAPGTGTLRAAPRADEFARAWASEPDVGRVAHGVPSRLDRLRTLGNAVVPQVAEFVGDIILDAERDARVR